MSWAASIDLRERVVKAYLAEEGSYAELAARFKVGVASVNRWLRRYRETGTVSPLPHRSANRPRIDEQGLATLQRIVRKHPDATLAELAAQHESAHGVRLATAIIYRALDRVGLTRKKRPFMRPSVKRTASA